MKQFGAENENIIIINTNVKMLFIKAITKL